MSENGYGHEEWLFRPEHTIDGWRYGFLQPALRAHADRYDASIDVVLYTIDPDGTRWYVGRIAGLSLLDVALAKAARDEFARRGWLAAMGDDLADLGLSLGNLKVAGDRSREIVNVRFRPDGVSMLAEPIRAPSSDVTRQRGRNRYQLYPLDTTPPPLVGSTADPQRPTSAYTYGTAPIVHADRRHNRLQLALVELLRKKFGAPNVAMEQAGVDIVVKYGGRVTFIEVKSESDARLALRSALGQLLEYALFSRRPATLPDLVIVAPGAPDAATEAYTQALRAALGLSVRYVRFDETITTCPI